MVAWFVISIIPSPLASGGQWEWVLKLWLSNWGYHLACDHVSQQYNCVVIWVTTHCTHLKAGTNDDSEVFLSFCLLLFLFTVRSVTNTDSRCKWLAFFLMPNWAMAASSAPPAPVPTHSEMLATTIVPVRSPCPHYSTTPTSDLNGKFPLPPLFVFYLFTNQPLTQWHQEPMQGINNTYIYGMWFIFIHNLHVFTIK